MSSTHLINEMLSCVKESYNLITGDPLYDSFRDYCMKTRGTPYSEDMSTIEFSLLKIIRQEREFRNIIAMEEELNRIKREKNELNEKLNEAISKLKQIQESLNKI